MGVCLVQLVSTSPILFLSPLFTGQGEKQMSEMQICSQHLLTGYCQKTRGMLVPFTLNSFSVCLLKVILSSIVFWTVNCKHQSKSLPECAKNVLFWQKQVWGRHSTKQSLLKWYSGFLAQTLTLVNIQGARLAKGKEKRAQAL